MKRLQSVRGLMVAVVVIAVVFAELSAQWRRGGFAFQGRHADLAAFCDSLARWARDNLDSVELHDEPGHHCEYCRGAGKSRFESWRREQEDKYRLRSREARWHALIAGSAAHGPDVDTGLGPPPPLLRRRAGRALRSADENKGERVVDSP